MTHLKDDDFDKLRRLSVENIQEDSVNTIYAKEMKESKPVDTRDKKFLEDLSRHLIERASRANISGLSRDDETASRLLGVTVEAVQKTQFVEHLPLMSTEEVSSLLGISTARLIDAFERANVLYGQAGRTAGNCLMEMMGC